MADQEVLRTLLGAESGFDDLDLEVLRSRRSYKWSAFPPDVLPAFVAEMDLPLAPSVISALMGAVESGDCGYARDDQVPAAFAGFADYRWSWEVDPARMVLVPDVMAGVARALEILTDTGDGVVLTPPVYGPFARTIEHLQRRVVEVPVVFDAGRWRLDLPAIAAAFEAGARAMVLCNPHNPTGSLPTATDLIELAELADRYGAGVISDEVHAPLTLPGRGFTPFLSLGERRAIAVTSASKAWNVAGLKCAVVIGGDADTTHVLQSLPVELRHPGHLGALTAMAAFSGEAAGDGWLARVNGHLQRQHERARALLASALPEIEAPEADASYLLWLDCRSLGLGESPADVFFAKGRVALSPGHEFGSQGAGFARLNIATSGELLLEAVTRMETAARAASRARPMG